MNESAVLMMLKAIRDAMSPSQHMGLIACPHQATLVFPEGGEIVGVPISLDTPEFVAVKEVIDQMSQTRRPTDTQARRLAARLHALGGVLERRAMLERTMMN